MKKQVKAIKIFYCYGVKDDAFLITLEKHLKPLKSPLQIITWWEGKIPGGADRQQEIDKQLRESDIILLLVSPDFLASDHCVMIRQQVLERRKTDKGFSVVPVILRPVGLDDNGAFDGLQQLPKNKLPVSKWRDKDEAWSEVRRGIVEVVEELRSQPQQLSDVRDGFMFTGFYPADGYRWDHDLRPAPGLVKPGSIPDAPWLVSAAVGIPELSQRYSVFRDKMVLRDFARLSPTAEAIQQFANHHGHLGDLMPIYYPDKAGQPDGILWAGESLQFWLGEIEEMSILVTLWEMVQDRQIEALKEHIIWKLDPPGVLFVRESRGGWGGAVIASDKILPGLFYQWNWGEVIRPALSYLCTQINKRLEGHVNPTLFPSQKVGQKAEMYMVPDSLRAALYLLLLMEVKEYSVEPE